jgi:MFS family permease
MIWVAVSAFVGRIVCMWLPDLIGRRTSGMLACLGGVATLIIAGYLADAYIGSVSVFWLMLMAHSFFGGGSYTIIAPCMAEVWPAGLRASGMGLGYGQEEGERGEPIARSTSVATYSRRIRSDAARGFGKGFGCRPRG